MLDYAGDELQTHQYTWQEYWFRCCFCLRWLPYESFTFQNEYSSSRCNDCQRLNYMRPEIAQRVARQVWAANRRAEKLNQPHRITTRQWEAILYHSRGKCQYCRGIYDPREVELDHIFPLSRCGLNLPHNIAAACKPCNRSKRARLIEPRQATHFDWPFPQPVDVYELAHWVNPS